MAEESWGVEARRMARFRFTAIDSDGKSKTGMVEAESEEAARNKVSTMGLMPTEVKPASGDGAKSGSTRSGMGEKAQRREKRKQAGGGGFSLPFGKIISFEDLTNFTRQLSTLLKSGLPLLRALEVLRRQDQNAKFNKLIGQVADAVRSGGTLSDALQAHPRVFNKLYLNMVRAGEAGGNLAEVLEGLAKFMEKAVRTGKKVKAAMVYPIVVMSVAAAIVGALMIWVVPSFQNIFAEMLEGAPLPVPTQLVIGFSQFIQSNILLTIVILAILVTGFQVFKNTEAGGKILDRLALMIPAFGTLARKASVARFSRTFGTLLDNGVPILEALVITREVVGNQCYAEALDRIHNRVRDGDALSVPMDLEKVFPPIVTSMVEVGEETGALPEMLGRIADNYEEDVDNAVAGITSIIEPIMIVFLALVVGFIVIALFLPIIEVIRSGFA